MRILKRAALFCTIAVMLAALVIGISIAVSPEIAWRFTVLKEKLSGQIPEIPLPLLIKWMKPGSPVYVGRLANSANVNVSIVNLHDDPQSAAAGAKVYGRICIECHGDNATGRTGPSLVAAVRNLTDWKFFSTVKWGRPKTIMMPQPLTDLEIWQVYAFIKKTSMEVAVAEKASNPGPAPISPVTADMLSSTDQSSEWLVYAGNYASQRHSAHSQITPQNVQNLRLAWAAQLSSAEPSLESTPIVHGGRMFVTQSPEGVTALDVRTGASLWVFHRPVPDDIPLCCGAQNRGIALLNDTVYVGTLDAHLIALDANTGHKRWDVIVGKWQDGYSITGAPLVIDDRIVVGVGGGDFGIRGFIAAYSASDGSQQWKFYTIPGPGEPGNETWVGDAWRHGGGATWSTGSYDPKLGLIYWGTGNPAPVYTTDNRANGSLFSCSVVAIDARTGKLRWYYQFTPSDDHDWDATQQLTLAEIPWHGATQPVVFQANRNGFFYLLDRQTGKYLNAKPFAKQTWSSGFSDDGHPVVRPDSHPTRTGAVVWPAAGGATNWWPTSFDPHRNLLFVPSVDAASIYFHDLVPEFHVGKNYSGSSYQRTANVPVTIAIRAIDVTTGNLRWDLTLASGGENVRGEMGGMLSTDSGLVFGAYAGKFFALDAETGKRIWDTPLGAIIHAPPITYLIDGVQYISLVAGRSVFTFTLPNSPHAAVESPAAKPPVSSPR
jgi:alcohol dehydrogenase (cytochrome c)